MKNIVFMGTPEFAASILQQLIEKTNYNIPLVISQPDRPVGRKQVLEPGAVKKIALDQDIEVFQPEQIDDSHAVNKIREAKPDLILTVAYGQKIPREILDFPEYGAINIHPSLLPKYRGGAPIHYAVKNGDKETGVTIMYMVEQMDAGDIIAQTTYPIDNDETTGELFHVLDDVAADLLIDTLPKIFERTIEAKQQNEDKVSYAPTISKANEQIDWHLTANDIHNHIRSLNPEPGAYTFYEENRLKIYESQVVNDSTDLTPGQVVDVMKKEFHVACGNGTILSIKEVQPAGKKSMPAVNFLNGAGSSLETGYQLG